MEIYVKQFNLTAKIVKILAFIGVLIWAIWSGVSKGDRFDFGLVSAGVVLAVLAYLCVGMFMFVRRNITGSILLSILISVGVMIFLAFLMDKATKSIKWFTDELSFYVFAAIGLILLVIDIRQVINYYKATRGGQQIIMAAQQEAPAMEVVLQDEPPVHPDLSAKLKSAKDL
ncbi:MAG: hypothetical protein KBA53_00580 [Thermoclostridium sp.]|nr:hypothetical protein [Thermoclostridium sp.]